MDNPEIMVTLGTQDTGQISVRENRRTNQEWTMVLRFSLTLICSVSCVPSATIVSVLYIPDWSFGFPWRLFVLCLVYPVLPLSLECLFLISPSFSLTLICPVPCVPSATIVSGKSGMYNPETMVALGTQDTEQISVRENRRTIQEWITQRQWRHWVHKIQDK
jgi:hypothetical protein